MKGVRFIALFWLAIAAAALAQNLPVQSSCTLGGQQVQTQGISSTTTVQASYPRCNVTVFNHDSRVPTIIYADQQGTRRSNPFQADTNGSWSFFIPANTVVDVVMNGGLPNAMPRGVTLVGIHGGWGLGGISTGSGLPVTNNVLAGDGNGAARDTGVQGTSGQLLALRYFFTDANMAMPFPVPQNGYGLLQWYAPGSHPGGIDVANGAAGFFGVSPTATAGGVLLVGTDNAGDSGVYLDCEVTGCTFPGNVTVGGSATFTGPTSVTASATFTGPTTSITNLVAANVHLGAGSLLDNSPICTQATGCGGTGGATYPPAGIGVSTGSGWSDASINPSTLASWPPAGIPVSTGSGWTTSIPPTQLPAPGNNGQILVNTNGIITATNTPSFTSITTGSITPVSEPLAINGAITSIRGTRIADGTNLNTIATCGDFDVANAANAPPQIAPNPLNRIALHVWCSADTAYFVQFAWNMTQFGQPTEMYVRNNRAGTWTVWSRVIGDDGAGDVSISGAFISGLATRETTGDLNAVTTCGYYHLFAPLQNMPPALAGQAGVGLENWCSGDPTYLVQLVWNMVEFGQPTRIWVRNARAGTWSGWTQILEDDGSGNVSIGGTMTAAAATVTGNAQIGGTLSANILSSSNAVTLSGTPDFNAIPGTGFYFLPDGCGANCPTSPDHSVDPRQGFLIQSAISPGTPSGQAWQMFQSVNDFISWGYLYTRVWDAQTGQWLPWRAFIPGSGSGLSGATTLPGTLVEHPLTSSGKVSRMVPDTPKSSKQECRKNASWHDGNYIYVCMKSGEVRRASLSLF